MRLSKTGYFPTASLVILGCCILASAQETDRTERGGSAIIGPDPLGYTALDHQTLQCPYVFVDISGTGSPLIFTAIGPDPSRDEGSAEVFLAQPFEFYGERVNVVTVSTNGYIGFGGGLGREDGGDFSNDCLLPAIPGNDLALNARVMAFHDDLTGEPGDGTVFYQYFSSCPRIAAAGQDEPCTVIQWHDRAVRGLDQPFDFEVFLYHKSYEVASQIAPPPGFDGATGTIGIQNASARSALAYACNSVGAISGQTAVCYFSPDFPAVDFPADLAVSLRSATTSVIPTNTLTYQVEVMNTGSQPVNLARLSFPLPSGVTDCEWVCESGRGSACPLPSGTGPLDLLIDLESGRSLYFVLSCDTAADTVAPIIGNAQVSTPALFPDTEPGDNTASYTHSICPFSTGYWLAVPFWPDVSNLLDLVPLVPQCDKRSVSLHAYPK